MPPVMIAPSPLAVVASADGWLAAVVVNALYSVTTFCWFSVPRTECAHADVERRGSARTRRSPVAGYENAPASSVGGRGARKVACGAGDRRRQSSRSGPSCSGWSPGRRAEAHDAVPPVCGASWSLGCWRAERPSVLKSTPDDAVVSLDIDRVVDDVHRSTHPAAKLQRRPSRPRCWR